MKNYAILRIAKLNNYGNIGSSLHHTFREIETLNANNELTGKNKILVGDDNSIDVVNKMRKIIEPLKQRSNSVKVVEFLQTFSNKENISLEEWTRQNVAWLKKNFGAENLVSSVLHMDETTPHIVSYVIPKVENKLCASHFFDGKVKMEKMQDSYAKAMKDFGLSRGEINSDAKHQTIRQFYGKITEVENEYKTNLKKLKKDFHKIKEPLPKPKVFETKTSYVEKVENNIDDVKKSLLRITNFNKKIMFDNKQKDEKIEKQKDEINNLKENNEILEAKLSSLFDEENVSKDDIKLLRKLDISLVANRLGFFGEIKKNTNAIDLVKEINNFNFEDSVKWLYHEFGADFCGFAVADNLANTKYLVNKPTRPFSPTENKIKNILQKQLDSLGCDKYRITIQSEDITFLPGKSFKNSTEKFYNKNEIINLIPFLAKENFLEKRNILLTPMDDNCYYILIDDCRLTKESLDKMQFCNYIETSKNSFQAVFKIPKNNFSREEDVIPFFNMLNEKYGDSKMKGLRHPFRMAGFQNMKQKHIDENGYGPYVKLLDSSNRFSEYCINNISKIKNNFSEKKQINTKNITQKYNM